MTAINQNFSMRSGESKEIVVTVTKENKSALDLTGSKISWTFSNITKTELNGISLSNPTQGEFTIHLDPNDTKNLAGVFAHEAEVIDILGNNSPILEGNITIKKRRTS